MHPRLFHSSLIKACFQLLFQTRHRATARWILSRHLEDIFQVWVPWEAQILPANTRLKEWSLINSHLGLLFNLAVSLLILRPVNRIYIINLKILCWLKILDKLIIKVNWTTRARMSIWYKVRQVTPFNLLSLWWMVLWTLSNCSMTTPWEDSRWVLARKNDSKSSSDNIIVTSTELHSKGSTSKQPMLSWAKVDNLRWFVVKNRLLPIIRLWT